MKQRIWISITLVLCVSFVMAMFTACPHVEVDTTPPASVTNVSVLATTDTITVSWMNPTDPDFSHTEVSVKNNVNGAIITQTIQGNAGASSATSFSGLNDNTEYTISFVTVDTSQNKSAATTMTAKTKLRDTTPPGEVESLTARALHQKVLLSWVNPYDEDFTSVEIFSMPAAGNLSNPVVVSDLTRLETSTFMATGLENVTEYIFKVRAIDASGNKSAWKSVTKAPVQSNLALTVTLPNDGENIILTNDRAPVTVSAHSNYQITKAVWKKGTKNVAVDPEVLLNDAGATEFSLTSDGMPSTFNVTENGSYDIAVVNESGCYEYEQVDVKTIDKTPLAAVTNLEIECDGTNIIVSWTNPEPENAYDAPVQNVVISYIFNDNPIDADNRSVTVDAGSQTYSLAIPNGKTENDFVRVKIKNVDEFGNISEETTSDYTYCCDCIMATMENVLSKIRNMTRSRKVIVVGEVQNNDLSAIKTGLTGLYSSNNSILVDLDLKHTEELTAIAFCSEYDDACKNISCIAIPNSVTSIESYAFYGCTSLTSVTIPSSVTSIGSSAFYGCRSLASITIPNSVTSIGNLAFSYCRNLREVRYEGNLENWLRKSFNTGFSGASWYFNGVLVENITIPSTITTIRNYAFDGCASLKSVTIPNGVTSIGSSAFKGCTSLTSITIPSTITTIRNYAFDGCASLKSVTIPNGVTSIGSSAFNGCTSLTSITIPDSVTSIGRSAFNGCTSLTSITIPSGVTSIEDSVFSGCSRLANITIPNGVSIIGYSAFSDCYALTSITIPSSVKRIGKYAFAGCTSLSRAVFADTTGCWFQTENSGYTGGTQCGDFYIDAKNNAKKLKELSGYYLYDYK